MRVTSVRMPSVALVRVTGVLAAGGAIPETRTSSQAISKRPVTAATRRPLTEMAITFANCAGPMLLLS